MSGTGRGGTAIRTNYSGTVGTIINKWWGGVKANNGKIYCVPYEETDILVIDPATDTAYRITGAATGSGIAKKQFMGGVLGSDAKIYCPPLVAAPGVSPDEFLVIDPATDTFSFSRLGLTASAFTETATSMIGCRWGVALNGGDRILFPRASSGGTHRLIDLNVLTGVATKRAGGGQNCSGGVLRPADGLVYFAPFGGTQIMRFNPTTNVFSFINALGAWNSGDTFEGAYVLNDGNVYLFCGNADNHARIRAGTTADKLEEHYSNGLNFIVVYFSSAIKWGQGAQLPDGSVYLPPMCASGWGIMSSTNTALLGVHDVPSRSGIYGPVTDLGLFLGEDQGGTDGTQPQKWRSAVRANDGRIFAIPWQADDVMVVTPDPPAPREPLDDAALIPAYGAGAAHGGRRPHDAAPIGDPTSLVDNAYILWDTRAWTGARRNATSTAYDAGVGHRALPNLGRAGQVFDLDVYYNPSDSTWAQLRWQSGDLIKWEDLGGVHGDAPWTWMLAMGETSDDLFLEADCIFDIGAGETFGLGMSARRLDAGTASQNTFFIGSRAGMSIRGVNWATQIHNRLLVVHEDYQAGGGIVGGGATMWAGYDNPLPRTESASPPDGTWEVLGYPGDRVVFDEFTGGFENFFFHPFSRKFLYLFGHIDAAFGAPVAGQFWSTIRGIALVRQTPTDALLQAWQDYWF